MKRKLLQGAKRGGEGDGNLVHCAFTGRMSESLWSAGATLIEQAFYRIKVHRSLLGGEAWWGFGWEKVEPHGSIGARFRNSQNCWP